MDSVSAGIVVFNHQVWYRAGRKRGVRWERATPRPPPELSPCQRPSRCNDVGWRGGPATPWLVLSESARLSQPSVPTESSESSDAATVHNRGMRDACGKTCRCSPHAKVVNDDRARGSIRPPQGRAALPGFPARMTSERRSVGTYRAGVIHDAELFTIGPDEIVVTFRTDDWSE